MYVTVHDFKYYNNTATNVALCILIKINGGEKPPFFHRKSDQGNTNAMKKKQSKVEKILKDNPFKSPNDPLGSYTGVAKNDEKPVQDADDL